MTYIICPLQFRPFIANAPRLIQHGKVRVQKTQWSHLKLGSGGPLKLLVVTVDFMFSSNPKLLTELDLYHFCLQQTCAPSNTYTC